MPLSITSRNKIGDRKREPCARVVWILGITSPAAHIPKLKENGALHAEISPPQGGDKTTIFAPPPSKGYLSALKQTQQTDQPQEAIREGEVMRES